VSEARIVPAPAELRQPERWRGANDQATALLLTARWQQGRARLRAHQGGNAVRDTIYFLIFEGFADWQAALALCEIRRPGDWQVRTVGFSSAAVVSMGGLAVQPDVSLAQIDLARAAMLIVPGGHLWLRGEGSEAVAILREARNAGVPVAAIDTGVVALGRARLLDDVRHTGNWPGRSRGRSLIIRASRSTTLRRLPSATAASLPPVIWAAWSLLATSSGPCIFTARTIASTGTGCSNTRSCRRGAWTKRRRPEERRQ
jgi:putative intracellular protease/amidase